ncbi:YbaK/EbsC family protein [Halobacteriaceae archaeon GCM10025711]
MHATAVQFAEDAAERYGVEVDVHEFPEGTKTAADAADAIGCDVAQIASSLVFTVEGEPVVVVTSGANRVSEDRLAAVFDADPAAVEMAGADEVKAATGWSIGGVPPFCHATDLRVVFDETLLEFDTVWAAAGTPEAVFPIDPERIVAIADAEPAAVAE